MFDVLLDDYGIGSDCNDVMMFMMSVDCKSEILNVG